VALVLGWDERNCVREALRGRATVRFVDRIDEVLKTLGEESRTVIGLLVEPVDRDNRGVAETVQSLRQRLPSLPIIGYCRIGHEHSAAILGLATAGVHELVFRGVDDSGIALRAVLGSAEQSCAAEVILGSLLPLLPPTLHPFARYCLNFPQSAHTVEEVACALGVNRKTLVNYCARACFPAPATLLGWCRLLLATHFLVTTTRTVEKIALRLDFPSDTALRNMMKRYTGMRARELRHPGGMLLVFGKLASVLAAHRTAHSAQV
jgi:AraC-like DNA-binding protein